MEINKARQNASMDEALFRKIFFDHICSDIQWTIDSKHYLSAAQLLLTGIEIIAGLARPLSREITSASEFRSWAEKYIKLSGKYYTLTPMDLWASRCGFLHGYTPLSKLVRSGKAVALCYVDDSQFAIVTGKSEIQMARVSLKHLLASYKDGLAQTCQMLASKPEILALVNHRLNIMFPSQNLPSEIQGPVG
jgi:hypothetical protein